MLVYLCGGINGLTDSQCIDWRERAKQLLNCDTLDPMRRDYRGVEADNVSAIVENDLIDLTSCTHVLVNASRPSWGTAMEIVYAHQKKRKVVAFVDGGRVSPWLAYHCMCVVNTLEEACGALVR